MGRALPGRSLGPGNHYGRLFLIAIPTKRTPPYLPTLLHGGITPCSLLIKSKGLISHRQRITAGEGFLSFLSECSLPGGTNQVTPSQDAGSNEEGGEEEQEEEEQTRAQERRPEESGGSPKDGRGHVCWIERQLPSTPTPNSPRPSCCVQLRMASGNELEIELLPRSSVGSRGLDRGQSRAWPL